MKISKLLTTAIFTSALTACATGHDRDPLDPFEPLNRAFDSFNNEVLDRALLKPLAKLYNQYIPMPVSESVNHFCSNLGELTVVTNDLLQSKFEQGLQDSTRFVYNTTFGIVGLFDVASAWNLPKHNEDFGQTLGYWGVGTGPYLVLPFLGPKTLRDTVGLIGDYPLNLTSQIESSRARNSAVALRTVDTRANLLGTERILEEAALDRYLFIRDAYLQHRKSLVYDGQPPIESEMEMR